MLHWVCGNSSNMQTLYKLSKSLKQIKNCMEAGKFEAAIRISENVQKERLDDDVFDVYDEYFVKQQFDMITLFLSCEREQLVIDLIKELRTHVLDKMFTSHLLMVSRLRKAQTDVGTLDTLPDLAKFEITKHIYDYL